MEIKIATNQEEINQAIQIRKTVFIDEQHVPVEVELDEHDKNATHFVGYLEGVPIVASRLRFTDQYGKLERICVLGSYRGQSYGKKIIDNMEQEIKKHDIFKAKLNAQTHALSFYESLGYSIVSEEFLDAGIPHMTMLKNL